MALECIRNGLGEVAIGGAKVGGDEGDFAGLFSFGGQFLGGACSLALLEAFELLLEFLGLLECLFDLFLEILDG